MKKLTMTVLAALTMLSTVPAFSQDTPQDQYLCKLQAGTCLKKADVIQRKMKKLESDVKKGKKTYSADDLKKIEDKLNEVEKMVDELKAK
jgi:hypothetical protein